MIAQSLFRLFPEDLEGELSCKLSAMVRRETLVSVAKRIGIGTFIHLSDSEEATGGRFKDSNLENTLEALIAAIYIDGGFYAAESFVNNFWNNICVKTLHAQKSAKNILQEITQKNKIDHPVYEVLEKNGPDHNPNFVVRVSIAEYKALIAEGKTVKYAEQKAAEKMIKAIKNDMKSTS